MTAAPFPAEWTPEVAHALAKPFDPAQIGKLPRGGDNAAKDQWRFCSDCKQKAPPRHFHVDYIGHAIVTDRLNSVVGPAGWSWTLLTVERDSSGRLLAVVGEMTVLGHTRGPEVGAPAATQREYGDALKSAISDYICRAAMRFGVALDLWAKQQLESAAATQESEGNAPSDPPDDGESRRKCGFWFHAWCAGREGEQWHRAGSGRRRKFRRWAYRGSVFPRWDDHDGAREFQRSRWP